MAIGEFITDWQGLLRFGLWSGQKPAAIAAGFREHLSPTATKLGGGKVTPAAELVPFKNPGCPLAGSRLRFPGTIGCFRHRRVPAIRSKRAET